MPVFENHRAYPKFVVELVKRLVFNYTPFGSANYPYNLDPIQLATIVNELVRLQDKTGAVVEIGVARGMTTRFIAEHLTSIGATNQIIYAIDTFNSFVKEDLEYEVNHRGKPLDDLTWFNYITYDKWCKNFSQFEFIKPIKTDCTKFDYKAIGPIKLALLDVDLYLPTKRTLPMLYDQLIDEGVIIVDDIISTPNYDGASQAYLEFCEQRELEPMFVGRKCATLLKGGHPKKTRIDHKPHVVGRRLRKGPGPALDAIVAP